LRSPEFRGLVARLGRTPAQVVFRFALQAGMLPLTGTTDPEHMREDLDLFDFELSPDEMQVVETIGS
jgi:diketogulonate reductase-like aldo/keto reductase